MSETREDRAFAEAAAKIVAEGVVDIVASFAPHMPVSAAAVSNEAIARLRAERDTLAAQVTTLQAQADEWQASARTAALGWKEAKAQVATLTAEVERLTQERDEAIAAKAHFDSPEVWMRWCDHRVLERAESAEAHAKSEAVRAAMSSRRADEFKARAAAAEARVTALEAALRRAHVKGCICVYCESAALTAPKEPAPPGE